MTTWVSTLGTICTVGVGAMALYQGEKVERLIATSLLAGLLIAPMLDTPGRTHGLQIGSTLADVILIAATFYGVATTQKRWLLVAAAFQLLATVTDLLASLDPGVDTWSYMTAGIILSDGVTVCLIFGVIGCMRARAKGREANGGHRGGQPSENE